MSGRLYIYGTGAHARKVFHCAAGLGWNVAGFVDDRPASSPISGIAVSLPGELAMPGRDDAMFVAIGDPWIRAALMNRLVAEGWDFPVLTHRSAWVAPDVVVGPGTLVAAGAILETGSVVGRGAIIDVGVVVDHDSRVGEFCHLRAGEVIGPRGDIQSPL